MQHRTRITVSVLALAASCLAGLAGIAPAKSDAAAANNAGKPNFVFILGEGNGWSDTSVQMDDRIANSRSPVYRTPNLERLAREGMRLSDFYAACPRCTPSRAGFFTGISPTRLHMTYVNRTGQEDGGGPRGARRPFVAAAAQKLVPPAPLIELPAGVLTVGDVLKTAGYATAHFGKWHVGRVSPARHGFDETDGANGNEGPEPGVAPNPKQAYALTERGIAFMQNQVKAGKPFYVQLSHYPGRSIEEALPETRRELEALPGFRPGRQAGQAAVIADMDKSIGLVLKALDELGVASNTYVIYSADHGTQGGSGVAPLSGGKGSLREGGVRVPFIVRGPGVKPGACSHVRGVCWDLLPTLAELAGVPQPPPAEVEGGSLAAVFKSGGTGTVRRPREEIVLHFPHYDLGNGGPASTAYQGHYKLSHSYDTGASSLFDLTTDLGEQNDLAAEMPERTSEMGARMRAYLKAVDAQMPARRP